MQSNLANRDVFINWVAPMHSCDTSHPIAISLPVNLNLKATFPDGAVKNGQECACLYRLYGQFSVGDVRSGMSGQKTSFGSAASTDKE